MPSSTWSPSAAEAWHYYPRVYRGNGNGTFTALGSELPAFFCTGGTFALGEMTGDSRLDIVGCDLSVYPNLGGGAFGAPIRNSGEYDHVAVVDANNDGKRDILADRSGSTDLLHGRGNGTFDPTTYVEANGQGISAMADFDLSGRPDVAVLGDDGRDDFVFHNSVLLGHPSGTFTKVTYPQAFWDPPSALVDLDADGKLDAVSEGFVPDFYLTDVIVRKGNGDGTFGASRIMIVPTPQPGTRSFGAAPGDFNGDGKTDLALGPAVLLGDGAGWFDGYQRFRDPAPEGVVLAADVDGNGVDDLLFTTSTADTIVVVRTRTTDSLDLPVTVTLESAPLSAPVTESFYALARGHAAGAGADGGGDLHDRRRGGGHRRGAERSGHGEDRRPGRRDAPSDRPLQRRRRVRGGRVGAANDRDRARRGVARPGQSAPGHHARGGAHQGLREIGPAGSHRHGDVDPRRRAGGNAAGAGLRLQPRHAARGTAVSGAPVQRRHETSAGRLGLELHHRRDQAVHRDERIREPVRQRGRRPPVTVTVTFPGEPDLNGTVDILAGDFTSSPPRS
jgi:hypothetical protein